MRADVAGDIRIGDSHAIDQPSDLVPAAYVQLVVHHVRSGDVVGDQREAIGPIGARRELDILPAECGRGGHGICRRGYGFSGDNGFLRDAGQNEFEMKHWTGVGSNKKALLLLLESFLLHRHRVVADGHGSELEFSIVICFLDLRPLRILSFQRDCGACNGQMLRIVHDATHCAENRGM